jgi:hypothetical protein
MLDSSLPKSVDLSNNLENKINVLGHGYNNKITTTILQIKSKEGVLQPSY